MFGGLAQCNNAVGVRDCEFKGWFPLGVDCRCQRACSAHITKETKNVSRCAGNLRLMETSLNARIISELLSLRTRHLTATAFALLGVEMPCTNRAGNYEMEANTSCSVSNL